MRQTFMTLAVLAFPGATLAQTGKDTPSFFAHHLSQIPSVTIVPMAILIVATAVSGVIVMRRKKPKD